MARYIDLEELERRIKENVPTSGDGNTPYEVDLLEWCKDECIRQGYAMPTADVVPKSEVAREIFEEIESEIKLALESNRKAKREHIDKNYYCLHAEFLSAVQGKIDALRGIDDFLTELKKKYTEDKP